MENFVSIVVLNWNTSDETIECLRSLEKQTYKNFEVLLIDQGSRTNEKRKIREFLEKEKNLRIRFIQNKKNVGFCEGNNIGIRKASGEIVVFLNNDTIAKKDWLENLLPCFQDDKVGAVGSKILFYDGKENNRVQYVGGRLTFYGMPISEGTGTLDRESYNKQKETFWAMGASFAVRKKIFDELGELFPKEYFIYFEEVDLCWRIKNLGYKVIFCPNSVVYHKGSIAIKKAGLTAKQNRLTTRNKLLTFWRNLPTAQAFLVTPIIIGYDFLRAVKHLLHADLDFLFGLILGIVDFFKTYRNVKKPKLGSLSQLSW
jgi:GT2 family glycosyltransferase